MTDIYDAYGRTFKTLRVSLTNICNLACAYCVDPSVKNSKNDQAEPGKKLLTLEQYVESIAKLHHVLQLDTVRLTGGEPMLYKQLLPLIEGIKHTGVKNIKMTSNGTLLKQKAVDLKEAGLSSVNISLDAVSADVSHKMNKRKFLDNILAGIESCMEVGIHVKVNCVMMKGVNDEHLLEVFEFCKQRAINVRFLELMQMGHLYNNFEDHFVSQSDILKAISARYNITPEKRAQGSTANYWTTHDGFTFGIVANVSSPFCNDCNRLRLDSYGNIFGCLSNNTPVPVIDYLNDEPALRKRLYTALSQKKTRFSGSELSMLHIGG